MKKKIHNIGLYKLPPRSICYMAYEPSNKKLAVSRSDSSIEIWNVTHNPFIEKTILRITNCTVESLAWSNKRLFSTGLQGTVIEYDLCRLNIKSSYPITSGAGWCMDICKNVIAVGSEMGYINILSIKDDENIEMVKLLDKQEGRIFCLKFDSTGQKIITGSIDTIRVWNVETGHAIHKMSTGRSENNKETIVWCVAITSDSTIISGDSRGRITFWDAVVGCQIESYLSHKADILSLALSENESTVYCAGVHATIMSFVKVQMKDNYKWVKGSQRKIHDHDVRSLLIVDNRLYSAGVDGYLAVSSYPPKQLFKYPPLLQQPVINTACTQNGLKFVLMRYPTYLELWKLGTVDDGKDNGEIEKDCSKLLRIVDAPKKMLQLKSCKDEMIGFSALSSDANWLIYSTYLYLRVYILDYKSGSIEISRIDELPSEIGSSVQIVITPCSTKAILANRDKNNLQVISLSTALSQVTLIQTIDINEYIKDTVFLMKISKCGKNLVVSDCTGRIAIWHLDKNGLWFYYHTLPKYHCACTTFSIQERTNFIVAVYADQKIIEYDIKRKQFTKFSTELNTRPTWLTRSWPIIGVSHDNRMENVIIFYDDSTIYIIDKDEQDNETISPKKRRRDSGDTKKSTRQNPVQIIKKYKHLVYLGQLVDDELVAVEVNPLSIIETLPPCLKLKQFGVS